MMREDSTNLLRYMLSWELGLELVIVFFEISYFNFFLCPR